VEDETATMARTVDQQQRASDLLERADQQATLERALVAVVENGSGRLVLVGGEAGAGSATGGSRCPHCGRDRSLPREIGKRQPARRSR
jgi:hypothetical protein